MIATTRREAVHFGLTRYRTGKLCVHGHDADRYTASGACTECVNRAAASVYETRMAATADKRGVRNALAETTFRCYLSDWATFSETAVAVTLARWPGLTRDDVVGKWKPFDRQVGTALYKMRVDAEDVGILREVARALLSAHTVDVDQYRRRAIEAAEAPRDNQAGEWDFK